jgi:hypothetical protein
MAINGYGGFDGIQERLLIEVKRKRVKEGE